MKICQSVSSISRIGAGVSGFLLPLSQHLVNADLTIEVLSLKDGYSEMDLPLWEPLQPVLLKNHFKLIGYASRFGEALDVIDPCLVHQHGLWLYPSLAVYRWTLKHNRPRVISPHGMLEPWAWQHHNWKKQPLWRLWEKNSLESAAAVHVTSEQEMFAVRERGITAPIALIPIGIDMPDLQNVITHCDPAGKKTMLFLSRIHPKKGLENLMHAWKMVNREDWQIIIVGPGDSAYIAELKGLVRQLGLENAFVFRDAVYGNQKWQLMADADLFVLPSFSENFGIVIAESLACEVPVITTNGAPWQGLNDYKCGWCIDIGVEPLAQALSTATALSSDELKEMGKRGKNYVEQSFVWNDSALKMKLLYQWVLDQTDKPEFVEEI